MTADHSLSYIILDVEAFFCEKSMRNFVKLDWLTLLDPMEKDLGFMRSQRGGGVTNFGMDVTMQFLDRNDLKVKSRTQNIGN